MHHCTTEPIPITNTNKGSCRNRQKSEFSELNLQRLNMLKVLKILVVSSCALLFSTVEAGRGEIFEVDMNGTLDERQKNYEEDEEDTLVPHR